MQKYILLVLLLLLPAVAGSVALTPIEYFPVVTGSDVDIYATSQFTANASGFVSVSWVINNALFRTDNFTNVTNGTVIVGQLLQSAYTQGDLIQTAMQAIVGVETDNETAVVVQCNDGFDNDGDAQIDFASIDGITATDSDCVSFDDDTETAGASCPSGSAGSIIFEDLAFTQAQAGSNITFNNYLDAIKNLVGDEIPCDNRDNDEDGLIDETCSSKNLTITTDTGTKTFSLYVLPGTQRTDRAVIISNNGAQAVVGLLRCEGSPACKYIDFDEDQKQILPSPDLAERIPFDISVPFTEEQGAVYTMQFLVIDKESGQKDSIVLELHMDRPIALFSKLQEFLTKPYCYKVNQPGAIALCLKMWQFLLAAILLISLITLVVIWLMYRSKKKALVRRLQGR